MVVARLSGITVRLPGVTTLIGGGLLLAVGTGLVGLAVADSFLEPMKIPLPGDGYLTSSLIFDLGVFAVVIGLVSAAMSRLADPPAATAPNAEHPTEVSAR